MTFKLPLKEKLYVEIRNGGKGRNVVGEFKDVLYEALSAKSIVRAKTLFNTQKSNYQVLSYEKHGDSANVSIIRLPKPPNQTSKEN